MASEYKKRGGGYTTDKEHKAENQKHLDNWTEEEWQTKEGSGMARQGDGTEKRYLPKEAWEQMTEEERDETDRKKQQGSKEGKQYVSNTANAKSVRKNVSKDADEHNQDEDRRDAQSCIHHWEDAAVLKKGQEDYREFKDQTQHDGVSQEQAQIDHSEAAHSDDQGKDASSKKRGRGANQSGASKKQKSSGTSGEPRGTAGDKTRVPRVGQTVQWKALPGYVEGEVVEVVYEQKTVQGKSVKAGKEDPRVVLRSSASGKIAVHKPEAVYFD